MLVFHITKLTILSAYLKYLFWIFSEFVYESGIVEINNKLSSMRIRGPGEVFAIAFTYFFLIYLFEKAWSFVLHTQFMQRVSNL